MSDSDSSKTPVGVFWAVWIGIVGGMLTYQFKLGGGILIGSDSRSNTGNPIVWLAVTSIVAASAVRWFVLPRFDNSRKRLVCMIVGLALSQAVTFFAIFLFDSGMPRTKMELFWLSLLSAIQFIPLYAIDLPENQNG
jgi:hypothetical protein